MINLVFVCGPTASGKTEYAIRLAEELNGEIVSADSMQIYKYMDIGSAKPSAEETARVKHYFVGEIDPSESFSAADYEKRAKAYISEIAAKGKLPIICGGTGLYINSLVYEMNFDAPEGSQEYRDALLERYDTPEKLHMRLCELDPAAGGEIHPNNVKRVLRAVERLEKGEGEIRRFTDADRLNPDFNSVMLCLDRDRSELYSRIDERVDKMFRQGLAGEVKKLMDMGFDSSDIAMKGIGYKEIIDAIDAGYPPESAAELIKLHSRHYAKRQLTWLRRYPQMKWFGISGDGFSDGVFAQMLDYIRSEMI